MEEREYREVNDTFREETTQCQLISCRRRMDSRVSNSRRLRIIHFISVRMYHKTRARTLARAYYLVPFVTKIFLLHEPSAITIVSILKNSLESEGMRRGLLN